MDSQGLVAVARDSIRRSGMLRGGEAVLVAVSGGADSVALLDVLGALAPELRLTLHVVHVHHGLRPEADADAGFVGGLCARLGIPFHLERVAVRREPPWEGLEAEARRARYGAFREVARRVGAQRVATAHTADDQAETVLMRLLEGAGPRGLAGIAPVRGIFIRPLLGARRADIEAHLRARGLAWVEDASNSDPRFLRNRIRHEVLPFLARGRRARHRRAPGALGRSRARHGRRSRARRRAGAAAARAAGRGGLGVERRRPGGAAGRGGGRDGAAGRARSRALGRPARPRPEGPSRAARARGAAGRAALGRRDRRAERPVAARGAGETPGARGPRVSGAGRAPASRGRPGAGRPLLRAGPRLCRSARGPRARPSMPISSRLGFTSAAGGAGTALRRSAALPSAGSSRS